MRLHPVGGGSLERGLVVLLDLVQPAWYDRGRERL